MRGNKIHPSTTKDMVSAATYINHSRSLEWLDNQSRTCEWLEYHSRSCEWSGSSGCGGDGVSFVFFRLSLLSFPWCDLQHLGQAWAEGKGELTASRLQTYRGRVGLITTDNMYMYRYDLFRSHATNGRTKQKAGGGVEVVEPG